MTKLRLALVAFFAAAFGLLSMGSASAYTPVADPEADAPAGPVEPGGTVTVGFSSDVPCDWTVTFAGQTVTSDSATTSFDAELTVPTEPGTYTGTAACTYDDSLVPTASGIAAASVDVAATETTTFTITVAGDAGAGDGSGSGVLPATGGPASTGLILGAVAIVAGIGALVFARRKKTTTV